MAERITDLVPAVLAGDEDALRALFDHALPRLIAIAIRVGGNPDDAEEAAQDAIWNALTKLRHLDFSKARGADPLFSYLATAAVNNIHSVQRRQKQERESLSRAVGGSAEGNPIASLDAPIHLSRTRTVADGSGRSLWSNDGSASDGDVTAAKRAFLESLSDDERQLAQLRAYGGAWEEIADEMGIEPATARQRWSRLLKKAQRYLSEQEESDAQPA